MSELLAILKYKSQQCQNEHTKSHKVFKVIVLHKHHLDSLREFWQCPPCNTIVYKNFIIKNENIQRTSCKVYRCMFFIFRTYTYMLHAPYAASSNILWPNQDCLQGHLCRKYSLHPALPYCSCQAYSWR
jgi:hypothetical protein